VVFILNVLKKAKENSTSVTLELKSPYRGLHSLFGKVLNIDEEKHSLLFYVTDFHAVEHFQLKDIDHIVVGNQLLSFIFIKD
jgi:hypothetical protein